MSMILTRPPLEVIGMNAAETTKRRSARLSQEGPENEPPNKKTKSNGAATTTTSVSTKQQDGNNDSSIGGKKKRKVYEEADDEFSFSRGKRTKRTKESVPAKSAEHKSVTAIEPTADSDISSKVKEPDSVTVPTKGVSAAVEINGDASKTVQRKNRRRLPTTPEHETTKKPTRRSKRLSDENAPQLSPRRPAHSKSHANADRSPSPQRARPVTVEKKRKEGINGVEEEKTMRIVLPFADTPIIRRNKEMRKASAEGHRRNSSGMRGRRASSLIDEGRGTALPHDEVPTAEFFKHISADLTEPRRMRCLLGWCGTRALPPKPVPPNESGATVNLEFQTTQAARAIQEEVSSDLISKGSLSDWFSRDESVQPPIPARKKPNPRNIANAAKVRELEKELERLNAERAEWDSVLGSASPAFLPPQDKKDADGGLQHLQPDLLDDTQRAILEQLQTSIDDTSLQPQNLQQRLRHLSENLEFAIDQFAHGIHALTTARDTAERVAEKSLAGAANALEEREKQRAASGKSADQMDSLRALARVLNSQRR